MSRNARSKSRNSSEIQGALLTDTNTTPPHKVTRRSRSIARVGKLPKGKQQQPNRPQTIDVSQSYTSQVSPETPHTGENMSTSPTDSGNENLNIQTVSTSVANYDPDPGMGDNTEDSTHGNSKQTSLPGDDESSGVDQPSTLLAQGGERPKG